MKSVQTVSYVEQLKQEIRDQVARNHHIEKSLASASAELSELVGTDPRALESHLLASLPSETEPHRPRAPQVRHNVKDLLAFTDDGKFVWNAYVLLLDREPDEDGFQSHLKALRSGRASKIDILARIHYSPEGRRNRVSVAGLLPRALFSKSLRLLKLNANRDPESQHHHG